jgi:hypothetical protein
MVQKMNLKRTIVSCCALLSVMVGALASVTGNISGTVADPSAAVIINVLVVAFNTETGIKQTTHTKRARLPLLF